MDNVTYKTSGVDIDAANAVKRQLKSLLKSNDPRVLNSIGSFGSLYSISFPEYKDPVLVLKTEEPGSKQVLAFQYDRFESIGKDMVNHLINDCIVMGAKPLTVQDAIICGKLESEKVIRIISGINAACQAQGCTLTGGEISEQPQVIPEGTYILTSSIVGIVDRQQVIDGSSISAGDVVIGIQSSGLHTNGYSLVRKILDQTPSLAKECLGGQTFIDLLLEPHRCYYSFLKDLFPRKVITGMAHITGGGIKENLDRILPSNVDAEVDLSSMTILPVFERIKQAGKIDDNEMLRTFNLGIGMTVVCRPDNVPEILDHLSSQGLYSNMIGVITPGTGVVQTTNTLRWLGW
jgi:phosphoribosylformylglycinamidine cyclo-ligase